MRLRLMFLSLSPDLEALHIPPQACDSATDCLLHNAGSRKNSNYTSQHPSLLIFSLIHAPAILTSIHAHRKGVMNCKRTRPIDSALQYDSTTRQPGWWRHCRLMGSIQHDLAMF